MGQRANALIFRAGVGSFWKIKNYPSDLRTDLIKKFNIYKIAHSFLETRNVEIIIYKNYIKFLYIKIYIFFYFYQKKYITLKKKSLKHLVSYNKKSAKKDILKIIKYFFFKKTFITKKTFLVFKKKNIKFFKFLIFNNKRFKLIVSKKEKSNLEEEQSKELLVYGNQLKISKDFVLLKKKQKLAKKKSLLFLFLINNLLFNKKIRIRKKKYLKLKQRFFFKKNSKLSYTKDYSIYKNNFYIYSICKKLFKGVSILGAFIKGIHFIWQTFINLLYINVNNVYLIFTYYNILYLQRYKVYLFQNLILLSKNIFRKEIFFFYKNLYFYKKFILFINNLKFKIYKVSSLITFTSLKFKFKRLHLEQTLFKAIKKNIRVFFKNTLSLLNVEKIIRVPKISRMWWNHYLYYFRDFINILYFAIYFRTSKLLAIFIAKHINNKKRHYNFLKCIKRIMRFFFSHEYLRKFSGMFIRVSGKFQGILRKRKFQISFGHTSLQSVSRYIDYSMENSFTRFGVFSIKVWLLY